MSMPTSVRAVVSSNVCHGYELITYRLSDLSILVGDFIRHETKIRIKENNLYEGFYGLGMGWFLMDQAEFDLFMEEFNRRRLTAGMAEVNPKEIQQLYLNKASS